MIQRNYIFLFPAALLLAWHSAWLANRSLQSYFHWAVVAETCFWIIMKIVIWVIPALLLICWVERQRPSQFLQLHHMGKGFAWGGIAGVVLIGINLVAAIFFSKSHFHIPTFSVVLLNAVLIAPLVEEITLRGFLLPCLQLRNVPFAIANTVTSATFVLLHLPGWYFQGKLTALFAVVQPMVFLSLLGLFLGWLKRRSGSLYAPLVTHVVNNIYSSLA